MDGELLLVVLSSVAQQEVENISANVKKGLKMKMQRGELVAFQGCLGYDYHPEDKSLTINEEEAKIIKYIFNRYVEDATFQGVDVDWYIKAQDIVLKKQVSSVSQNQQSQGKQKTWQ